MVFADDNLEGLATVAEAADYLSVSRTTVYQLMDGGDLKFLKVGRCRRLPWTELRRFVSEKLVPVS